jgi:hypothetical protein
LSAVFTQPANLNQQGYLKAQLLLISANFVTFSPKLCQSLIIPALTDGLEKSVMTAQEHARELLAQKRQQDEHLHESMLTRATENL